MIHQSKLDLSKAHRRGYSLLELVIASLLLITVMTLVTSLCFQIDRVWKDIRHTRAARHELINQLDRLARMEPEQVAKYLEKQLRPSEVCQAQLDSPVVSGQLIRDEIGTRITLEINWERKIAGQPLALSGWIVDGTEPGNGVEEDGR